MNTKRVLVAYATQSGSTEEVAKVVAEELGKAGVEVEVRRLEEVASLEPYAAAVIGAPMILGWHRSATGFVRKHQTALSHLPVAFFFTAMSLTQTGTEAVQGVPVVVDPGLAVPPVEAGHLNFRERYATVEHYLGPVLKAAPHVKPVSAGFFGGKLEFYRLGLLPMLFVTLVIQARPADRRNWPLIHQWAAGLRSELLGQDHNGHG